MTKTDAMTVGTAVTTMLAESGYAGLRVVLERLNPFAPDPDQGTDWFVAIEDDLDDLPEPQ